MHNKDIEKAKLRKRRKRTKAKEVFNSSKQLRKTKIVAEDIVLKHNAKLELDRSTAKKLAYKQIGPYYVKKAISKKGTYKLKEFDGTPILGTHPGNRLKKFVRREGFYKPLV